MTISIPVTSNARKDNAEIQCVIRTVAVCRTGAVGAASAAEVEEGPRSGAYAESDIVVSMGYR
jgi:hypothetical protein